MTFLIWMQARKKERYGPRAELFLIVVFSLLIIRVPYSLWYIDNIILDSIYSLSNAIFVLLIHGAPIIFWGVFAPLYVYRTEIEPWKKRTIPSPKDFAMNAYTASKLQEAKGLLDKGIISMEEFLEIKKEAIGSNEIVDELVPTIHDIKTEDKRANKDIERGSSKMKELKELTEMKEKSLISDDEYEKMKKEIIG